MVNFRVESDLLRLPARTYLVERDCAAFRALLAKTLKLGKMEFIDSWESNGSTFVKLVTAPELGNWVPKSLRRYLEGPQGLEYTDTIEYNPKLLAASPYRLPTTSIPSFFSDRVEIMTELSIVEEGESCCRQVLEGHIKVKVLGMGKMIEGIIEESVRKTYEVLGQVVERWCSIREELMLQPDGPSQLQGTIPFKFSTMGAQALEHLEQDLCGSLQAPYVPSPVGGASKWKRPPPLEVDAAEAHVDKTQTLLSPLTTRDTEETFQDTSENLLSPGTPSSQPLSPRQSGITARSSKAADAKDSPSLFPTASVRRYGRMDSIESAELRTSFGRLNCPSIKSDEGSEYFDAGDLVFCPGCNGCSNCHGLDATTTEALLLDRKRALAAVGSSQEVDVLTLRSGRSTERLLSSQDSAHLLAVHEGVGHLQATHCKRAVSTQTSRPSSTKAGHRRRSSLFCALGPMTTDAEEFNQDFQDWTKVWSDMHVAEYDMPNPSARLLHLTALLVSWGLLKIVETKRRRSASTPGPGGQDRLINSPTSTPQGGDGSGGISRVRGRWMFRCFSCYVPEEQAIILKERVLSHKKEAKNKQKQRLLLGKQYTRMV